MALLKLVAALCALHIVLGADPAVKIVQTYPQTTIVNGKPTLAVERDSDAFLACRVNKMPAFLKVRWYAQKFDTETLVPISVNSDTQEPFKYLIDKPSVNNWRLRIQNVQEYDNALYICSVHTGPQIGLNDSRVVTTIQVPQVIDIHTSSDTTAEEGDKVELTCAADGIPEPQITWQRAGGDILPTGGREYSGKKLKFESVGRTHRGHYMCIAQNRAGKDVRRIYLNVKYAPEIKSRQSESFGGVGSNQELKCEATGNPVPSEQQVLWYRDGAPLENGNKYSFRNYSGSNYVLMKLKINDITDRDFGKYRCYAENSEGNGQHFIQLSRSQGNAGKGRANALSSGSTAFTILAVTTVNSVFYF